MQDLYNIVVVALKDMKKLPDLDSWKREITKVEMIQSLCSSLLFFLELRAFSSTPIDHSFVSPAKFTMTVPLKSREAIKKDIDYTTTEFGMIVEIVSSILVDDKRSADSYSKYVLPSKTYTRRRGIINDHLLVIMAQLTLIQPSIHRTFSQQMN